MAGKMVEALIAKLGEPIEEQGATCTKCRYEEQMLAHARRKQGAARHLLALLGPEAYLDEPRILLALDYSPLDYRRARKVVETWGMMERLEHVPEYLVDIQEPVRKAVAKLPPRTKRGPLGKVKVYGVGGSAAPAGIAREIIENSGCLGFDFEIVRRDAPRFEGLSDDTLLIFASFSGNTEETVHCLTLALKSGRAKGRMLALSKGGTLATMAANAKIPWIEIPSRVLQPRESAAYQVSAILGIISELELPSGTRRSKPFRLDMKTLNATGKRLRGLWTRVHFEVPFRDNEAKQEAAKLVCGDAGGMEAGDGHMPACFPRMPIVLSGAPNQAVAYEFYTQLCEASKLVCHIATCPEALHNLVESMKFSLASRQGAPWSLYFIESADDEPRVAERWRYTLKEIFPELEPCSYPAEGETAFERSMYLYYFNAWLRLYMAFLNGAEPLPVPTMNYMKEYMQPIPRPRDP